MTLEELYRQGVAGLIPGETAALDARALLLRASGLSLFEYLRDPARPADGRLEARYRRWIRLRREGLPVSYLTGEREFWSLPFEVGPGVFIPRPETELLVELVLERTNGRGPARLLDVGTGSGCIALTLASERPQACIWGLDVSPAALRAARRNGKRLFPDRMKRGREGEIRVLRSDHFSALKRIRPRPLFDVIVSNPPYVSADEWESLEPEVKNFEPQEALVPGATGLEALSLIIRESPSYLKSGGWLVLELGAEQADNVLRDFAEGWRDVALHRDLRGLPRAVSARWEAPSEFGV